MVSKLGNCHRRAGRHQHQARRELAVALLHHAAPGRARLPAAGPTGSSVTSARLPPALSADRQRAGERAPRGRAWRRAGGGGLGRLVVVGVADRRRLRRRSIGDLLTGAVVTRGGAPSRKRGRDRGQRLGTGEQLGGREQDLGAAAIAERERLLGLIEQVGGAADLGGALVDRPGEHRLRGGRSWRRRPGRRRPRPRPGPGPGPASAAPGRPRRHTRSRPRDRPSRTRAHHGRFYDRPRGLGSGRARAVGERHTPTRCEWSSHPRPRCILGTWSLRRSPDLAGLERARRGRRREHRRWCWCSTRSRSCRSPLPAVAVVAGAR